MNVILIGQVAAVAAVSRGDTHFDCVSRRTIALMAVARRVEPAKVFSIYRLISNRIRSLYDNCRRIDYSAGVAWLAANRAGDDCQLTSDGDDDCVMAAAVAVIWIESLCSGHVHGCLS